MILVPTRPCCLLVRSIHTASNLFSPPDPVSHMRPIIYSDAPAPPPPSFIRHPYSLTEFSSGRPQDSALQFQLQRQQLDDFHHSFWFDSNTRFETAKQAVLAGLPSSASPLDKERTLSEFYREWYLQEAPRTDTYTIEWRRRNIALIKLNARLRLQNLTHSVSDFFSFEN
ncbi:hypothetical protein H0H87_010775 [Tephrocybe sp. NHM501043]|nr:hypothetical protein H0H87_010775 [Tephrocybe sp. NHM501043]